VLDDILGVGLAADERRGDAQQVSRVAVGQRAESRVIAPGGLLRELFVRLLHAPAAKDPRRPAVAP
jgi:hypothetical protein